MTDSRGRSNVRRLDGTRNVIASIREAGAGSGQTLASEARPGLAGCRHLAPWIVTRSSIVNDGRVR